MTAVNVVLSRPLSNYCYMPSLKQLLFYVVPQSSDKQSLILGVLPPGLSINSFIVSLLDVQMIKFDWLASIESELYERIRVINISRAQQHQ